MSDTLDFINKLNEGIEGVKKPNKIINEAAEDIKEYRYITNHGIGPGTVPKGTYVRSEDLDGGKTAIYLNRPLSNEELNKYDIKPENIQENTKSLTEDENTDKVIYMNTWANYNENGADLSKYGIEDGWMTIEEAKNFANQHEEDEPFINDVDIELPFEVNEYSNVEDTLDQIDDYMLLDDNDKEVISAIIEVESNDYNNAKDIYDSRDYIYFHGVDNDEDLARAYIDLGDIESIIPKQNIENYIDRDKVEQYVLDNYTTDELTDEDIQSIIDDEITNAIATNASKVLEQWFDYDAYGRDLTYTGFSYTSNGAIEIL